MSSDHEDTSFGDLNERPFMMLQRAREGSALMIESSIALRVVFAFVLEPASLAHRPRHNFVCGNNSDHHRFNVPSCAD